MIEMSTILFADDDAAIRALVGDILRADGHVVRMAASGEEALAEIRRAPPDLTILDYRMGSPNGFEVCRQVKANPQFEHMPVLILTGLGAVEDRIRGFAAGADDYLPKPFDARELAARVRAMLRLTEQSRWLNPTTGLPGGEVIEREFERRRHVGEPFTMCYLDLDQFKAFNDRFGFAVADAVIGAVGKSLRESIFGTGTFAGHIGGDDFIVMCDRDEARAIVDAAQPAVRATLARLVPAEVVARGTYVGKARDRLEGMVPLTRVSAVVLHLDPRLLPRLAELAATAAEVKAVAKDSTVSGIVEMDITR